VLDCLPQYYIHRLMSSSYKCTRPIYYGLVIGLVKGFCVFLHLEPVCLFCVFVYFPVCVELSVPVQVIAWKDSSPT